MGKGVGGGGWGENGEGSGRGEGGRGEGAESNELLSPMNTPRCEILTDTTGYKLHMPTQESCSAYTVVHMTSLLTSPHA